MTSTTRMPSAELTGPFAYAVKRFSRKVLGKVPDAVGAYWHNRRVLNTMMGVGRKVQAWDQLAPDLSSYAHMAVASLVGCSWCLDYNYFEAHNKGLDEAKASQVPRWRDADVFSPLERDVMAYAEAMSQTPPEVSDDLFARLLDQLGEAAMVELTAVVGFANLTTRCNVALGIHSQGFSDACEIPLAQPSAGYATSA